MKLELRGITKRFPGVIANEGVNLTVEPGEIHALLGENGAGKTTLMNVLYGLYRPDEGEIFIDDAPVVMRDPGEAIRAGIGMVHQHFMLVPVFTVTENVMLGVESTRGPFRIIDQRAAKARIEEIAARHGLDVDPDALVEDLPVGVRQRVEIIKTLYRRSSLLILDEPSAVLTPQETGELFDIMRSLVATGTSIIFITHKLNEVLEIADRITVLRRGRVVGTASPDEATQQSLAQMMVGRPVDLDVDKTPATPGNPVLEIAGLSVSDDRGHPAVRDLDLVVRAGEIVAIAGVQGNGQTELVEAITGLRRVTGGSIRIEGTEIRPDPRRVLEAGVAHVPEDRLEEGLIPGFTIAENLVLNTYYLKPFADGVRLHRDAILATATALVDEFDVRTPSVFNAVANLSGGNQQKVIIAREFTRPIRLLVAAQPTRGLDVGSIEYIHRRVVEKRDAGAAVLIVSTELDEVMALGDRIAVMYQGRIVAILDPAEATPERLGLFMGGALVQPLDGPAYTPDEAPGPPGQPGPHVAQGPDAGAQAGGPLP
ncbi:MAG TPA: ABC transporter ATP-binding protein [Candidatus Limnocylindrales bacterium]|nr:ABC transporter ATP-binding protein [Candidatus Limnocylindrales bacterium]